jgi:hypothetical protein
MRKESETSRKELLKAISAMLSTYEWLTDQEPTIGCDITFFKEMGKTVDSPDNQETYTYNGESFTRVSKTIK